MAEHKHTFVEYKFPNGESVKCTIAFRFLLKLKEQNKKIYERLNHCLINGMSELLDAAYVLYGAYLCGCYAGENGGNENIMEEMDFIDRLDGDAYNVMLTGSSLISKKKN